MYFLISGPATRYEIVVSWRVPRRLLSPTYKEILLSLSVKELSQLNIPKDHLWRVDPLIQTRLGIPDSNQPGYTLILAVVLVAAGLGISGTIETLASIAARE